MLCISKAILTVQQRLTSSLCSLLLLLLLRPLPLFDWNVECWKAKALNYVHSIDILQHSNPIENIDFPTCSYFVRFRFQFPFFYISLVHFCILCWTFFCKIFRRSYDFCTKLVYSNCSNVWSLNRSFYLAIIPSNYHLNFFPPLSSALVHLLLIACLHFI